MKKKQFLAKATVLLSASHQSVQADCNGGNLCLCSRADRQGTFPTKQPACLQSCDRVYKQQGAIRMKGLYQHWHQQMCSEAVFWVVLY